MNVAARLCEHCKAVDRQLVVSGDLLGVMTIPADLTIDEGGSSACRGRQPENGPSDSMRGRGADAERRLS
jgi:hypothetical protein